MIYILDFDNTVFKNKYYVSSFSNLDNVIPRKELSKILGKRINNNILLTGRPNYKRKEILSLLKNKGYTFKRVIFRKFSYGNILTYRKRYVNWKIREIKKIKKQYNEPIIVIDDNKKVIEKCKELKIKCINFNLNKT